MYRYYVHVRVPVGRIRPAARVVESSESKSRPRSAATNGRIFFILQTWQKRPHISTFALVLTTLPHSSIFSSDNMRSSKPRSDTIGRRGVFLALALAGIFGSSAASSISAVAENTPANHHKDLIDRYLQAISEQDGSGGTAAPIGDSSTSEENQRCFAGWDASCQDNPSFLSVMGASCKMHERFDCTMLHAIGYNEQEQYDVVNNCPCACKVPCGQWTFTPSAVPSFVPSSAPSARPR